ncbi:SufB/SufD family protein [Vallitalea guaymasensis]|uniref:SufD family Fe-S cluster assembly protein n=1 Tax=Vallitalea guaymasensis TaxID=1185412 RepID=A0A8J8M7R5_9FIRM|nr:SufD family Fe-S cluster assembly protein [Vallitalea guaymasensis]QUH27927.1 SufD family Fe-S cluster assembly protein [Vallitalea guaymasensis]
MKNVKHVSYLQLDNDVQIHEEKDLIILPITKAFDTYDWVRGFYCKKPENGYFIWVKKSVDKPIITNILMCSMYVVQNTNNLVVVEKNVEAKLQSVCAARKKYLYGKHSGETKIVAKENAMIEINNFHSWGKYDTVESSMELILKENAQVSYNNKCHEVPMQMNIRNSNYLDKKASLNFVTTVLAERGKVDMYDDTYLNGKDANGISRVRMISRYKSQINAYSNMIGNEAGIGHLDCMGLLLSDSGSIVAEPKLVNRNKDASLTHEASVGKISEDILNYLRSRGLTEDQAIDLVVTGFLGEEEEIVIDGSNIQSKQYM